MDMLMVDLQNIKAKEGDEVIILTVILLWKNFLDIAKPFLMKFLLLFLEESKRIYIKD